MMQGDAYNIPVDILMNGKPLEGATEIEVMIGGIRKTLTGGEVAPTTEAGEYLVQLTQEETFRLDAEAAVIVRVLFPDGSVLGTQAGRLLIDRSRSKVVLVNG